MKVMKAMKYLTGFATAIARGPRVPQRSLLGELDARRLYLGEGCSSLFRYCTDVLHFSEHAAYHRIEAARAARRFPAILALVADGALTLTAVAMLSPHLTTDNAEAVLAAARHKRKREVEQLIAAIAPADPPRYLVRRLGPLSVLAPPSALAPPPAYSPQSAHSPQPMPAPVATQAAQASSAQLPDAGAHAAMTAERGFAALTASAAARPDLSGHTLRLAHPVGQRPTLVPLSDDRYLIKVTVSAATHDKLRRAQDLMRHANPAGDPGEVLDQALSLLIAQLERQKVGLVAKPRASRSSSTPTGSRHIPAAVRREVWSRDAGRCAYEGRRGRCEETGRLEFHHLQPFADGGPATPANIALRCRAHNQYEARLHFADG
jgi:hypothetical protein